MINPFKKTKKEPENAKEALEAFKDMKSQFQKVLKELEELKKEHQFSVQKVGIVRFNPFSGVGSDQSFSIALLDRKDDGVVITSLYTRNESRIYGKPIKSGQSEYSLSEEEKQAIENAKNPNAQS